MPTEQEAFQEAVNAVLEAAMFENWMRFYFISEKEDGALVMDLPAKSMERIQELYPRLYPMAEKLNGKPVDFETSRKAVLEHIMEQLEGKKFAKGYGQQILQSSTFQIRLQLFHTWEQLHEDQLDRGFAEFGAWQNLFAQWLDSPGAREIAKKLAGRDGDA